MGGRGGPGGGPGGRGGQFGGGQGMGGGESALKAQSSIFTAPYPNALLDAGYQVVPDDYDSLS